MSDDRTKHLRRTAPPRRVTRPVAPGVKKDSLEVLRDLTKTNPEAAEIIREGVAGVHARLQFLETAVRAILHASLPREMLPSLNEETGSQATGFMHITEESIETSTAYAPILFGRSDGSLLVGLAPADAADEVLASLKKIMEQKGTEEMLATGSEVRLNPDAEGEGGGTLQ